MNKKKEIIAKIKHQLKYPQYTLELMASLPKNKLRNIPPEFIQDALRAINKITRFLRKLELD